VGAGALVVVGAVHLNLYAGPAAYRHIPTVGPLFLFNAVFSFVLALAVLVRPSAFVSALAAVFSFATMGGYALSLSVGLFGFYEPGISYSGDTAIASEALAGVVFLACAVADLLERLHRHREDRRSATSSPPS
jgi:hypothetical protein